MPSEYYTKSFYEQLRDGVRRSAEVIVPIVRQLVPLHSVIDVGCGEGTWLAVFQEFGVRDIFGIDGDHIERSSLRVPPDCFQATDLAHGEVLLDRTFDLAVSLEVAEHLPVESASAFIRSLTRLAPVILFSAAVPFQGGVNHFNEQWPEYWAARFAKHDFVTIDAIRKRVWQNESVDWWYAQNTLLFVHRDMLKSNEQLKVEYALTNTAQLSLVHPRKYLSLQNEYSIVRDRETALRHKASLLVRTLLRRVWSHAKSAHRR